MSNVYIGIPRRYTYTIKMLRTNDDYRDDLSDREYRRNISKEKIK